MTFDQSNATEAAVALHGTSFDPAPDASRDGASAAALLLDAGGRPDAPPRHINSLQGLHHRAARSALGYARLLGRDACVDILLRHERARDEAARQAARSEAEAGKRLSIAAAEATMLP